MFEAVNTQDRIRVATTLDSQLSITKCASSPFKRTFDLILSAALLVFLSPALILIALAVKLDSKGPALFRQRRTGLNGKMFSIYKFRSMTVTEDGHKVTQAKVGDKRVTRIGAFLRKSSLDEVPQLLNILKGEMSFVGPRPHALAHDAEFARLVANYDDRFLAKPGLTGLAQIRGFRGEIHTVSDIENRVDADIEYATTWKPHSDIVIIAKTFPLIFGDKNAY